MPNAALRRSTSVIHMTGAPPVEIFDDEWPTIAEYKTWTGARPSMSSDRAWVRVRRGPDGRLIVYGLRRQGQREALAGFVVPPGSRHGSADRELLVAAIKDACALVGVEPQAVFDTLPPEAL